MDDDYLDLYLDYSDMLQEARDENARLREQLDTAEHNRVRNVREYARLCHENDRLHDLCGILVHCMSDADGCDTCAINGNPCEVSQPFGACDSLWEMLKEMGVVTDEEA